MGQDQRKWLRCDICQLAIDADVLFAAQEGGTGPHHGMTGWYIAITHVDPCGTDFLRQVDVGEYRHQPCRGCGRTMLIRAKSRRTHCSPRCRQHDYRHRGALAATALADGKVLYRDDLYHLTKPCSQLSSVLTVTRVSQLRGGCGAGQGVVV